MRKRLAILVLLVGLPLYVVAAVSLIGWIDRAWGRLPIWAEVPLYVVLAFAWILPLKPLFRGVGQAGPEQ
jgi:hypothetical protein